MNLPEFADDLSELLAPLTWVEVAYVERPEFHGGGIVQFGSAITCYRFALLNDSEEWVFLEPRNEEMDLDEDKTKIPFARSSHFLALAYAEQEAASIMLARQLGGVAGRDLEDDLHRVRYFFVSLPWTIPASHPDHDAVNEAATRAIWTVNGLREDDAPVTAPRDAD